LRNRDTPSSSVSMPHFKKCPNCEREIDMGYHICPFCHTYITGLNEF
jgi:ribosomal protein L32